MTQEQTPELWRVFTILYGKKWFISELNQVGSVSSLITKQNEGFKTECIHVNLEDARLIILHNRNIGERWGIVNKQGLQLVLDEYDNLFKRI